MLLRLAIFSYVNQARLAGGGIMFSADLFVCPVYLPIHPLVHLFICYQTYFELYILNE